MKKTFLAAFFVLSGYWVFSETEEMDYLLFLPNSSSMFVNEVQAAIQLDDTAKYLRSRNLGPGQVLVYGYTADVANGVDSVGLSRDRALFVINELQKRGISRDVFAIPIGYGQVNHWGNNSSEKDRSLNRRVRIFIDDTILTPNIMRNGESLISSPVQYANEEARPNIPWWMLFLALLAATAAVLYLAFASRESQSNDIVPHKTPEPIPAAEKVKIKILERDEISNYAYGLYQQRYCQDGSDADDWDQSIRDLTDYYEARGYQVLLYWETLPLLSQPV
jgi:hypothetical protein